MDKFTAVQYFIYVNMQRHERNIKGRNQLVKKFAEEHQLSGQFCCNSRSCYAFWNYFYTCTPNDFGIWACPERSNNLGIEKENEGAIA